MQLTPQTTLLKEALAQFESQANAKVDTGDPPNVCVWADSLREAFDQLSEVVNGRRQRIHEKLFAEISDQDESEQAHIHELRTADAQIDKLLELVKSQLIVLSMHSTTEVEPRIENQTDGQEELVQDVAVRSMELVHWIREQEESVTTWFAEAFRLGG